ncbi:MAG: GAF domain-containing protein [Deltaproteobacteria bacterium]|nr:GAF domain-containing protein [Deltaproteobacteria bacterium]
MQDERTVETGLDELSRSELIEALREARRELTCAPSEAEHSLREELQALDRAYLEIARALAGPGGMEGVARVVAEQARIIAGAEYAAVGLGDASDAPFTSWSAAGVPPDLLQTLGRYPRAVGVLGQVKRGSQPVRLRDVRKDPAFVGLAPGHPELTSFLGLQIRHDAAVLGHLILANKQGAEEFTEADQCTLMVLAERAGIALEVARLRQVELRERLRLGLLADTGRVLATGLDADAAIAAVVRLPVPELADLAAAYLLEDDRLRLVGATHRDPVKTPLLTHLLAKFDPLDSRGSATVRALETRRPVLVPEYTQAMLDAVIEDPEARSLARQIFTRPVMSVMVLPLVARGHVLGVMACAWSDSDRRYDQSDLVLAEEIVDRLALAVDNVLLYRRTAEALRNRDSILAIVAHDLRSPLAAIHLSADLLAQACPPGLEDAKKRITTVKRSAERMNRLIEDLVQATLIEGGRLALDRQPQEARALIAETRSTFDSIARQKALRLEAAVAPRLPRVLCDRERVLQTLSNLVDNAIKFAPDGSTIVLEATMRGAEICFSVRDRGPGIPLEQLPHIFDRYWKGVPSGRHGPGLGLYIAKGIVEAHGGRLWVESVPGRGAAFSFTLPAEPGPDARS